MAKYPPDWDVVELGNIGTWLSGGTPSTGNPAYWGGDIPWISAASLKTFDIHGSERNITELGAVSGTRRVPAGTVIFVVRGMSLKSEFRVGVTSREVAFGQDCKAILAPSGIKSRYLAYALKAREAEILAMVDEAGHGTGRLPSGQLAKLSIGVPEERVQGEILEILDSIDESIKSAARIVDKLQKFRTGLVSAMLANSGNERRLGEFIESGPQNGLYKPSSAYADNGIRIVRIDSFGDGVIYPLSGLKRVSVSGSELDLYRLHVDDILINRVNTIQLVGKSALVSNLAEAVVFESNIMRFRVCSAELLPTFLVQVLQTDSVKGYFQSSAKSAVSQASINQADVLGCPVVLPNMTVQRRIVSVVGGIDDRISCAATLLGKLRFVKQGMMERMLTGRIRAKVGEAVEGKVEGAND